MTSGGLAAVSSSAFAALYSAFGKYDVVHIHAEGPAFFAWLPKMFGKRVVVTVHGIDFFEKYDDIISFEEWCHFYIRHGEYLKTKELYDSVFDERKYLIEDQPEYFYRSYIDFTLAHQFDLTPALRCFVEHSDEFKDIFINSNEHHRQEVIKSVSSSKKPQSLQKYSSKIRGNPSSKPVHQCTNQTIIHPLITPHPEERIWAGRTPRAPDAPKIKHNGMKRFYMVDMGVKNVILSFYQKKCESLSLAKEKSLSQ